ncbi:cation:proton antiporter [Natronorubrum daqingense]|uniref:Monovalent cation:H+ antiporter-2, CPA2 family n=1 Tax=Natronorubrum daqingense TaxID=588898 RepID=A0A1N7E0J3_9EURY|nr:cation:proton antiporter [Natronorubrum daqingense]APX98160.1 potassium transporter Kef [Natronorubrum daqingense]SIR81590.1 monovalent cation:H+ antiporter-2, CPA2 family [Natronorubrum daqingense]
MSDLLTAVSIMFIVAGPFLLVADRYDLPTVPLLVLAGIVTGFGFDAFGIDEALTLELAQYGIALLVFSFGVEIDISAVRTVLVDSELAALAQILVVGSLGVGFGVILGVPPEEALFLGVAAALSSTLVGTALLQTEIEMNLVRGRLARSIHFSQDLLAILLVLGLSAGTLAVGPIATLVGYGFALLVGAVLVNRYLFDVIGRLAGDSDELMILGVVSLLAVFVGAAEFAGISLAVGAFAAGLAVRHDPVEHLGLFNGLASIKDFFVAIFFLTIGALVVLPFVELGWSESVEKLVLVAGLVFLTTVVKPAVTTIILIYRGYEARSATLASFSSDQVSEFALIIAIEALLLGLLTQSVFDAIILAAAVTMVTSSLTQRYDERIYRSLADRGVITGRHGKIDEWSDVSAHLFDHVVIVGYGRHGRKLVETCEALEQPYVVVENDPLRRELVTEECDAFVFGDAMERYTWEKANVKDAKLVVSTVDSEPVSRRVLSFGSQSDVILQASDQPTAFDLLDDGALYVSVPNLLAGKQLTHQIRALLDDDVSPAELRSEQLQEIENQPDVPHHHL